MSMPPGMPATGAPTGPYAFTTMNRTVSLSNSTTFLSLPVQRHITNNTSYNNANSFIYVIRSEYYHTNTTSTTIQMMHFLTD